MKQIEKLNNLIKKVLKEELGEAGDKMIVPSNDPKKAEKLKAAKAAGVTAVVDDPADPASEKLKETDIEETETPLTHDLAGKIAEVIDGLKAITEAPKDKKHAKYAEKVMKHVEAARTALEALTGHETVLEEKDAAQAEKDAEGHLKGIRKHMSKVIKDKETLDRIMNKMPVGKAMELKKAAGGELDEEKVAKAMLKYVIKEGAFAVKKKPSQDQLNEGKFDSIIAGISGALIALGIGGAYGNALFTQRDKEYKDDVAISNIERKLDITLLDRKDIEGKTLSAPMSIDPKDFNKIDSLYNKIVEKYPKYKLDFGDTISSKGAKNDIAKQSLESLKRAVEISAIAKAVSDHSKDEKDLADDIK